MTVTERARTDRRFQRMSSVGKWVRDHISKKLGRALVDIVDNFWSESFDR